MTHKAKVTLERTPSRIRVEKLLALLSEGELSRNEIAEKLCMSEASADRYLKFLRQAGKVYVKRWERATGPHGGMPTAFYIAGDKEDGLRPKPLSKAEQSRKKYKRMKTEEPAKYAAYLDRAKLRAKMRNREKRGVPFVPADPMLAWIPRRAA